MYYVTNTIANANAKFQNSSTVSKLTTNSSVSRSGIFKEVDALVTSAQMRFTVDTDSEEKNIVELVYAAGGTVNITDSYDERNNVRNDSNYLCEGYTSLTMPLVNLVNLSGVGNDNAGMILGTAGFAPTFSIATADGSYRSNGARYSRYGTISSNYTVMDKDNVLFVKFGCNVVTFPNPALRVDTTITQEVKLFNRSDGDLFLVGPGLGVTLRDWEGAILHNDGTQWYMMLVH